jgi:hypothetical protein
MRRREFIATALVAPLLARWRQARTGSARVSNPNGAIAIANGPAARSLDVPLAFLDGGSHDALLVRDQMDEPAAARVERATVRASDSLRIDLRPGGGFVGRFS